MKPPWFSSAVRQIKAVFALSGHLGPVKICMIIGVCINMTRP